MSVATLVFRSSPRSASGCGFRGPRFPRAGLNASAYPPVGSRFAIACGCSFASDRCERLCVLSGGLCCTADHPRVLSSSEVMLSSASSVLLPDVPVSLPRPDFVFTYTGRPADRGRSRRGTRPSQLCTPRLVIVPSPVRRRDRQVHLPISSLVVPAFAHECRARLSGFPASTSAGEEFRRGSVYLMLRPDDSLAPLMDPTLRRQGLYPRSFHRNGRPVPMSG